MQMSATLSDECYPGYCVYRKKTIPTSSLEWLGEKEYPKSNQKKKGSEFSSDVGRKQK